jgi:hypothetical protein
MSKNASQFYNHCCQLLEVFNPFEPKLSAHFMLQMTQDLNGNSLLCMLMADLRFSQHRSASSVVDLCQRVNTGCGLGGVVY